MKNLSRLPDYLSSNQVQVLLLVAYLLVLCCALSLGVLALFGGAAALSFFLGGLIHSGASLVQGLYYFAYSGAAAARKMVTALGWGLGIKFLLVIILSSLAIYTLNWIEPAGLIFGVILMHLLHSLGNAFFMH